MQLVWWVVHAMKAIVVFHYRVVILFWNYLTHHKYVDSCGGLSQ